MESALGVHHAVSARKNLILLTLSFALTVTLFMAFSACFDIIKKLLPSVGSFAPDVEIVGVDNTNAMDRSIKEEIAAIPRLIDLISYDDHMFASAEKSVVSGDLLKVTGGSDYALTIFNDGSRLDTGDRIGMGDSEITVACVVSEGIGGWGNPLVVCTEETVRAVGMSMKQMTKMIAAEALTYALCGMTVGLAGGLFIHKLIITKLLITHFGGAWKIPAEPMWEILILFLMSCFAAVYVPVKRLRAMAVTETINEL